MSARNIHFGKSDVSFTLFRAVGEAHVELNRFAVVNAVSPHSLDHPLCLFVGTLFLGFRR
jgi:hypothetical protein